MFWPPGMRTLTDPIEVKQKDKAAGKITFRRPPPETVGGQNTSLAPVPVAIPQVERNPFCALISTQEDGSLQTTLAPAAQISEDGPSADRAEPMMLLDRPVGTVAMSPRRWFVGHGDLEMPDVDTADMDTAVELGLEVGEEFQTLMEAEASNVVAETQLTEGQLLPLADSQPTSEQAPIYILGRLPLEGVYPHSANLSISGCSATTTVAVS